MELIRSLMEMAEVKTADDVLAHLKKAYSSKHTKEDAVNMKKSIEKFLKQGWSFDDIITYMRNTEEVNPDIPEGIALQRMKKISDKYK